jgi:hypothetical protein
VKCVVKFLECVAKFLECVEKFLECVEKLRPLCITKGFKRAFDLLFRIEKWF